MTKVTKVTKAQVEAHAKATTVTSNCKDIIALYQNGNRKSWEVYGKYDKERKVNCVRGQKCYKTVVFYGWHKVTKMEAADLLAVYGLTIEEFVAIENGNYEIVDDNKNVEEIDLDEYAVSAEAFDSAVDAEIENAKAAAIETENVPAEVEEVNAEKNSLKAKVAEIERNDMAIKVQQIDAYICSNSNRIKNLNAAIGGFKADLDYQAEYFKEMLKENDERGMFSTARTIKNQLNHIAELEKEIADLEKRIKALKAERVQYTDKKAKVAEILNRPRKSIVDWKATFDDMQISEILNLQKDLKKYLKLGQIDLAENVFSMLKTLCRNYRAVAA